MTRPRHRSALLVVIALLAGACSSRSTARPKPTPTSISTSSNAPPVCELFARLSVLDRSTSVARNLLGDDWLVLRAVVVAANDTNQQLYPAIAAETRGATRSDAQRVSAFMPRSRALALHSKTLTDYLNAVHRLTGDAETQAAAGRVYADLAETCRGLSPTPSTRLASTVTVTFDVRYANAVRGRAHVYYNDPTGIPVVLDVATPWTSSPLEYPKTEVLRLVATTTPRYDTDIQCGIKVGRSAGGVGKDLGTSSCGIGENSQRPGDLDAIGPPT